jgi:hypothetical protein
MAVMKPPTHTQLFPKTTKALRSTISLVSGGTPVTITISPADLRSLKRLSKVSHYIADRMGNERAEKEQTALACVLDDTIGKIERALPAKGRAA